MNYCKYSIIPTQHYPLRCSSCGKELEFIPYYTQLIELYTGINIQNGGDNYLGIGLRVPMCDECDSDISKTLIKTENRHKYVSYFLTIATVVSFSMIPVSGFSWIAIGILILLIILLCIHSRHGSEYQNEKMKNCGLSDVERAFEYLTQNSWTQNTGLIDERTNYKEDNLMMDLDKICGDGKFCILDSETGRIVDYENPVVLKDIYFGSIHTEYQD